MAVGDQFLNSKTSRGGRPKGEAKGQVQYRLPLELVIRVQERGAEWFEATLRAALDRPAALPVVAEPALRRAVKVDAPAKGGMVSLQQALDRRRSNDEMWRRLNGK